MPERCYCILYVNSNQLFPPVGALLPRRIRRFKMIDAQSPAEIASRARWQAWRGDVEPLAVKHRYFSVISSDKRLISRDPLKHVQWILGNFESSYCLATLKETGAEYGISFWWGAKKGGGPQVSFELADLMVKHQLKIGFELHD